MDVHGEATPRRMDLSPKRELIPISPALVPIVLVGILCLATLRDGHRWGDDFALYLCHARNIAEGRDYRDTGYIYNPSISSLSPRIYPPVFPLMLAPVYKVFGLNMMALKAVIVVTFLGFLGVCWWGFRNCFHPFILTLFMALLGFNPYFWRFKGNILSDIPFLLWTYVWLFAVDRAQARGAVRLVRTLGDSLVLGVLLYLAYGTRSVGLVLVPCLWLTDLLRHRRIGRLTLGTTVVFGLLLALQMVLIGSSDASYLDQFTGNPVGVIQENLTGYAQSFFDFWRSDLPKEYRLGLFAILGLLALGGYATRVREGGRIFEVFAPVYTVAILAWPSFQGGRFLLPLFPLFLLYVFIGLDRLGQRFPGRTRFWAFTSLLPLLGIQYVAGLAAVDFGPLREGVGKQETRACFTYIREQTDPQAVVVFCKPRALALFTGRRASGYHRPKTDAALWDYFRRIRAAYVVVGFPRQVDFDMDGYFLLPFVVKHRECFQEVFANHDFKVFRLLSTPGGTSPVNVSNDRGSFPAGSASAGSGPPVARAPG